MTLLGHRALPGRLLFNNGACMTLFPTINLNSLCLMDGQAEMCSQRDEEVRR